MEFAANQNADQSVAIRRNRRWLYLSPGRLLFLLLPAEAVLLLLGWLGSLPMGWAVLIAIASVAMTMVLMFLWFVLALLFHRRFQFSIRSLLVLTAAVAAACSWMAVEMKRAREQRNAVEAILKSKGHVLLGSLRFGKDMELINQSTAPHGPIWLMNLLGSDFFENVVSVDFTKLQISDAGLKNVEGLTQLQDLSLYDTDVTDAGLEHLKGLTQLQKLELVDTQVTDAGLDHLKGLTKLQYLFLINTHVTDAGLEHLKGLTQLDTLMLDDTQVTDVGLEHLKGLTKLQWLRLNDTRVTDTGLEHLTGLATLHGLMLSNTQVTDAGLELLEGLAKLQYLDVRGTKVTDEGIKKLQQALPNCKIER
jgi:hypothetical protein